MQHYGAIRHPPANGRSRPFAWMALLKQAGLTNLAWHVALLWLPIEVRPVTAYLHIASALFCSFKWQIQGKSTKQTPEACVSHTCVQVHVCRYQAVSACSDMYCTQCNATQNNLCVDHTHGHMQTETMKNISSTECTKT